MTHDECLMPWYECRTFVIRHSCWVIP
jgi:hypothetical protein